MSSARHLIASIVNFVLLAPTRCIGKMLEIIGLLIANHSKVLHAYFVLPVGIQRTDFLLKTISLRIVISIIGLIHDLNAGFVRQAAIQSKNKMLKIIRHIHADRFILAVRSLFQVLGNLPLILLFILLQITLPIRQLMADTMMIDARRLVIVQSLACAQTVLLLALTRTVYVFIASVVSPTKHAYTVDEYSHFHLPCSALLCSPLLYSLSLVHLFTYFFVAHTEHCVSLM